MGAFNRRALARRLSVAAGLAAAGLIVAAGEVPAGTGGALASASVGRGQVVEQAGVVTQRVTATTAGARSGSVLLSDDVLPGIASLPSSPSATATQVQVGVILDGPDQSALDAAYRAVYTPGSPEYHQFLTADEVAARFGAPASTVGAVERWATRAGMQLTFVSADNEYLLLSGTTAQAERTFSVKLRNYLTGAAPFYANANAPTVPAGVSGVIGLNNLLRSRTFNRAPAASVRHGIPSQDTCLGSSCIGLTTPQDMWSIYDQPSNLADPNADFGQGQQMAVLGEGAVYGVLADLRNFEQEFSLPRIPVTVRKVGNNDFSDTSGNGEWDIDTQSSSGMSPKALGETLYFAKDLTDSSVLADFAAWSLDPTGPLQASASFGECEQDPTSSPTFNNAATAGVLAGAAGVMFAKQSESVLAKAALQGKTLFSSTGDTGSSCPVINANVNGVGYEALPETSYPASSRYVVAVGGTVLYGTANTVKSPASNAKRAMETAWTYTGGGNSFYIAEPPYQKGISLLDDQDCVSQPNGVPYKSPTPCRGVPDVSAQSGDVISNGYAVTMAGTRDSAGGGTSLSSPLWMGMWTRVQAVAPRTRTGQFTLGFANETLYRVGKNTAQDAKAFFDIGGGPPASPITGNGYYTALPRSGFDPSGWDYVSGLGSPDVRHLATAATGKTNLTPTNNVTAQPRPDCGPPDTGLVPCPRPPATACPAGGPLWVNPAHTSSDLVGNQDPQLSLISGSMARSGSSLVVTLKVTDLSTNVPAGATGESWYLIWTYKGTSYFAVAEVGPGGFMNFGDGTWSQSTGFAQANNDTGTFKPGPGGTVVVKVPIVNVGLTLATAPGAVLSQPAGKTFTEEGVPPTPIAGSSGAQFGVDTGGPLCNFTVPA